MRLLTTSFVSLLTSSPLLWTGSSFSRLGSVLLKQDSNPSLIALHSDYLFPSSFSFRLARSGYFCLHEELQKWFTVDWHLHVHSQPFLATNRTYLRTYIDRRNAQRKKWAFTSACLSLTNRLLPACLWSVFLTECFPVNVWYLARHNRVRASTEP